MLYLDNLNEIQKMISDCYTLLNTSGKILLEFRDFSMMEDLKDRIIVKKMNGDIKVVSLQYDNNYVYTIDCIINARTAECNKSISRKIRINHTLVEKYLSDQGYCNIVANSINGKVIMFAEK